MVLDGYDGLIAAQGADLGISPWLTVDQGRISLFADATGDHAWIHVDTERATAGPYGSTIAHGPLTLSLITRMAADVFQVSGLTFALHYGYDRVRFTNPVPVDSRVRVHVRLTKVDGDRSRVKAHYHVDLRIEGDDRLACATDLIYLYTF